MMIEPRKKHDVIIGIDPDKEKSGIGILNMSTRKLELTNMSFPVLLDNLQAWKKDEADNNRKVIVIVEAGWMNAKSCFHKAQGKSADKIAKDVGANHETGRKIIEMCEHYGIEVIAQAPLRKSWRGKDGKITHEELAYFTGITGRENQDARDAGLLAWNYAGMPIRTKVWK